MNIMILIVMIIMMRILKIERVMMEIAGMNGECHVFISSCLQQMSVLCVCITCD